MPNDVALANSPKTYSTESPKRPWLGDAPIQLRLTTAETSELQFFFGQYEAEIGWRSNCGPMLDALISSGKELAENPWLPLFNEKELAELEKKMEPTPAKVGAEGPRDMFDSMNEVIDRGIVRKGNRVYRVLQWMIAHGAAHEVTVLHRLYGPRDPNARYTVFDDVAPLAEFTAAVESARQTLSVKLAEARVAGFLGGREAHGATATKHRVDLLEAERKRLRGKGLTPAQVSWRKDVLRQLRSLKRQASEVAASPILQESLSTEDAAIAQLRGAVAGSTLLEVTTADALRWRLDYHGKRGTRGRPDKDAFKAWQTERAVFVTDVRLEAERLRVAAANSYRAAKSAFGEATRVKTSERWAPVFNLVTKGFDWQPVVG